MKTMLTLRTLTVLVLLAGPSAPARAQEPVVGSADPESLFTSKDPKLNASKQVALHIMRDLLEAGHWSEAPKYLTERYLQHNPGIPSSRASVMKAFSGRPERPIPGPKGWRTKVVSVVAEGDLVVVGVVRELPDPRKAGATYTTTWFDMFRIVDGKIVEHWDSATKGPGPTRAPAKA